VVEIRQTRTATVWVISYSEPKRWADWHIGSCASHSAFRKAEHLSTSRSSSRPQRSV